MDKTELLKFFTELLPKGLRKAYLDLRSCYRNRSLFEKVSIPANFL